MSPLQVCPEESNWAADVGASFNCLSMAKNPKVKHTCKAGPRAPRLGVMCRGDGEGGGVRMGRCRRGGVCMEMLAAQSKQDIWKGRQGCWSETYFLVEAPDSRDVVVNATCR